MDQNFSKDEALKTMRTIEALISEVGDADDHMRNRENCITIDGGLWKRLTRAIEAVKKDLEKGHASVGAKSENYN